jgi:hypothetical protein
VLEFYRTKGGRVFVDKTMAKIAVALERIGDSLEAIAEVLAEEAELQADKEAER